MEENTTQAKVCNGCQVSKPLDEFAVIATRKSGRGARCKECEKERRRQYRLKNPDKIRALALAYRASGKAKERNRVYTKRYPDRVKAWKRAWRVRDRGQTDRRYTRRHPEKYRAHVAVMMAVRSGKLLQQSCEVCGNSKAEAHHDDYSKPLDVRWLCCTHHREHHRKLKSLAIV